LTAISKTFEDLCAKNDGALIPYLTVGDPRLRDTPKLVGALIEGGADIIELGLPFSDPIADGPTIQEAVSRSLASGTTPEGVLSVAETIHEKYDTPLVLMTYYNPIFRSGLSKFLDRAVKAGVAGIIVPDVPVEESQNLRAECSVRDLDTILLASPSTNEKRLKEILERTTGYLYLISLYGITGTRARISQGALTLVKRFSKIIDGSLPLAAGFGISKPDHVRAIIRAGADGAIVGSAFVKVIETHQNDLKKAVARLGRLAKAMKQATKKT